MQKQLPSDAQRHPGLDALRVFLILAVVLGHVLEISPPFQGRELLYRTVYCFHMGAFLFLFGYFAKFSPQRILRGYLLPYLLFQFLYILFLRHVLHTTRQMQFTTPYWILWYLLACAFYQLLIPFFGVGSWKTHLAYLVGAVLLSLAVGLDNTVGYYATVSRFFVYLPWFLLGYYARRYGGQLRPWVKGHRDFLLVLSVLMIICSLFYLRMDKFQSDALFGSYPYSKKDYGPIQRLLFLVMGLGWTGFLLILFSRRRRSIPLLTGLGQNTLSVFLLHGFVIKAIPKRVPWLMSLPLVTLWLTALLLLLFGNPLIGKLFRILFTPAPRQKQTP